MDSHVQNRIIKDKAEYLTKRILISDREITPEVREEAFELYSLITNGNSADKYLIHPKTEEVYYISEEDYTKIKTLVSEGQKITAIKELRTILGTDLRTTEELVEGGFGV